jgi:DNA-binding NarL/FixJ family response regulator
MTVETTMKIESRLHQERLRERAIVRDLLSSESVCLCSVWQELVEGHARVSDAFFTEERCYLIVEANSRSLPVLAGRRLEIVEGILCGQDQKSVAIELALAPSTIALNARLGLAAVGSSTRPSRVHPLLMLAAKASSERATSQLGTFSLLYEGGLELRVISVPRPEQPLRPLLPPAELSVIGSLVEGLSYEEIARRRGTSTRTVANQITAVFRRLRVSGRNQMLHRLFKNENLSLLPVSPTLPPPLVTEPRRPSAAAVGGFAPSHGASLRRLG